MFYSIGLFNNQAKKLRQLLSAGFVLGTAVGIVSFFAAPTEKERQHSCLVPDLPGRQTTFVRKVVIKLN